MKGSLTDHRRGDVEDGRDVTCFSEALGLCALELLHLCHHGFAALGGDEVELRVGPRKEFDAHALAPLERVGRGGDASALPAGLQRVDGRGVALWEKGAPLQ